jgi:hypothetical protein
MYWTPEFWSAVQWKLHSLLAVEFEVLAAMLVW